MKIRSIWVLLFTVMTIAGGCFADAEQTKEGKSSMKYFDLKGYMQEEVKRVPGFAPFEKIVEVDDSVEKKRVDQIDLKRELKIFIDSDINRPAWSDKYSIDSLFDNAGQLHQLVYKALDDKLRTRSLVVQFSDSRVSKIEIENGSNSSIAETRQLLKYDPKAGYSIESQQDVKLMDDRRYRIQVSYN